MASLAAAQHGVVTSRQLSALGVSRPAVNHQLHLGRLVRLHYGVYAVGHVALTAHGRWASAVLAGGDGAVLSHRSAAGLWGLIAPTGHAVEVSHPTRRRARQSLLLHRSPVPGDERIVEAGIPTTTPGRTLIDLAAVLSPARLERAFHEVEVRRLGDPVGMETLLRRHRGRRGVTHIRALLADARFGEDVTRHELEARFHALIARFRLPRPACNAVVEGFEVDASWSAQKLIVELDGHAVHATRRSFERDRARDRRLTLAGWRVVRVTWRQLHADPGTLACDLRRLLAAVDDGRGAR